MTERNLIQSPEMLRGLQQATGLRQGSVTPTLSEHVQPVIILNDASRERTRTVPRFVANVEAQATSQPLLINFFNPPESKVVANVLMLHVSIYEQGDDIKWWFDFQDYLTTQLGATQRGLRKCATPFVGGSPVPVNIPGVDALKLPARSTVRITPVETTAAGAFIHVDNTERINSIDWCPESGLLLPPGTGLVFCHYLVSTVFSHDAVTYEWEEEPLV